jgi:sterol desaturase/sphingolipid hydroxylase (fatty acid hydroxylase superfamily)
MLPQNIVSQAPPLILAASYIALWLLQRPDALRPQVKGRKLRNMLVASLAFAASGLGAAVVTAVAEATTRNRWGALWLIGAPDIARILLGVLVIDVVDYWRHRVSHKLPLLWRLHRMHHTDLVVDVTTSLRSHPIEMLLRGAILAAATLALGIPV